MSILTYQMRYPEYAHIGFKILCTIWGFHTIRYMETTMWQRERKLEYLKSIEMILQKKVETQTKTIMK